MSGYSYLKSNEQLNKTKYQSDSFSIRSPLCFNLTKGENCANEKFKNYKSCQAEKQ